MLIFPPNPVKAKYLMGILVLFELFSGVSGFNTGIAHFAHLGGVIAGLILITMWGKNHLFRR
jgi:membrane associated rhomboid family serine protease